MREWNDRVLTGFAAYNEIVVIHEVIECHNVVNKLISRMIDFRAARGKRQPTPPEKARNERVDNGKHEPEEDRKLELMETVALKYLPVSRGRHSGAANEYWSMHVRIVVSRLKRIYPGGRFGAWEQRATWAQVVLAYSYGALANIVCSSYAGPYAAKDDKCRFVKSETSI